MSPDLEQLLRDTAVRPSAAPDPGALVARGRRRRRRRHGVVGAGTTATLLAAVIVIGPWASLAPPEIVDQPITTSPTAPDGRDGTDGEPGPTEATPRTGEDRDDMEERVALLEERRRQLRAQLDEQAMMLAELRSLESELRFDREQEGEDVERQLAELAERRVHLDATIARLATEQFAVERELVELGVLADPVAVARAAATDEDRELTDALVALAREPSRVALEDVPFSDTVELGLADELLRDTDRAALADPSTWVFDVEIFRAYTGPFSALDVLADDAPTQTLVGEHPHCASPPVPAPPGFGAHRRVSVQPIAITSCLEWWTVDLFVTGDGRVEAVTLDLYEP